MDVYCSLPYTQEPQNTLREFDLYLPPSQTTARPLICFVHGGAWRSYATLLLSAVWIINDEPREDKRDHSILAEQLARHTGFPVAVPNYRLTPQEKTEDNILRHPSHAEDILQFLEFLLTWEGPSGYTGIFDPTQLFLMGHSCSTHILSSILLDSSAVTPTLTPSAALLCAIKGVVMCEGIYDLDLLNANFPDYLEWFVAPAFGKRDSYALFATTSYPCVTFDFNWLLIHSQGDTLIDFSQSEKMVEHLKSEYGPAADRQVSYNTSMTQGHDEILVTDDFVSIVGRFVKGE